MDSLLSSTGVLKRDLLGRLQETTCKPLVNFLRDPFSSTWENTTTVEFCWVSGALTNVFAQAEWQDCERLVGVIVSLNLPMRGDCIVMREWHLPPDAFHEEKAATMRALVRNDRVSLWTALTCLNPANLRAVVGLPGVTDEFSRQWDALKEPLFVEQCREYAVCDEMCCPICDPVLSVLEIKAATVRGDVSVQCAAGLNGMPRDLCAMIASFVL